MSTINLEKYKNIQQSKDIIHDLSQIIQILTLANRGLRGFYYYGPVKDLLVNLKDCKTILEIHKNHHENLIKEGSKSEE